MAFSKLFLMDESPKSKTQCSCKRENDDIDYKRFFKAALGTKVVALITSCHKCGKIRMSLKKSDPGR